MPALTFRSATILDVGAITALVNIAYRGEASRRGWTTEADLLDGLRTTAAEVQQLIESDHSTLLLGVTDDEVVASVCLEQTAHAAHIGIFVVRPDLQGSGIGKQLLTYAESYAREYWAVKEFAMHVITLRHELIAFYERRGYHRTGILKNFPVNPEMWQPKLDNLQLELLEKSV